MQLSNQGVRGEGTSIHVRCQDQENVTWLQNKQIIHEEVNKAELILYARTCMHLAWSAQQADL